MLGKYLRHHIGHHHAQFRRLQALVFAGDIAARGDGGNRGCVGRRTANAQFFQRVYQRSFGVAWRRLGEVLVSVRVGQAQFHAVFQGGQRGVRFFLHIVLSLFIYGGEAREALVLAGIDEFIARIRRDLRAQRIVNGGRHLAGEEAIVNQLVQPVLIARKRGLEAARAGESMLVGRMASCASCALFWLLYTLGSAGK